MVDRFEADNEASLLRGRSRRRARNAAARERSLSVTASCGRKAELAEQFARRFIPARLDQQIEDFTLLVDGAPQVHPPAGDPHDHLVEVPCAVGMVAPALEQPLAAAHETGTRGAGPRR